MAGTSPAMTSKGSDEGNDDSYWSLNGSDPQE